MRKQHLIVTVVLLLGLLAASAAMAAQGMALSYIMLDELKQSLSDGNVFLADVRTAEEFGQGHIKGAVNIPPDKFFFIGGLLPKEKDTAIVFYCRGYG